MIQLCVVPDLSSTTNKTPIRNKSKEIVVIEFANKNGCEMFRHCNLCGSEIENKNAGQNLCNYSGHVPSKPIAASLKRCESDEHNCSAKCCIDS